MSTFALISWFDKPLARCQMNAKLKNSAWLASRRTRKLHLVIVQFINQCNEAPVRSGEQITAAKRKPAPKTSKWQVSIKLENPIQVERNKPGFLSEIASQVGNITNAKSWVGFGQSNVLFGSIGRMAQFVEGEPGNTWPVELGKEIKKQNPRTTISKKTPEDGQQTPGVRTKEWKSRTFRGTSDWNMAGWRNFNNCLLDWGFLGEALEESFKLFYTRKLEETRMLMIADKSGKRLGGKKREAEMLVKGNLWLESP